MQSFDCNHSTCSTHDFVRCSTDECGCKSALRLHRLQPRTRSQFGTRVKVKMCVCVRGRLGEEEGGKRQRGLRVVGGRQGRREMERGGGGTCKSFSSPLFGDFDELPSRKTVITQLLPSAHVAQCASRRVTRVYIAVCIAEHALHRMRCNAFSYALQCMKIQNALQCIAEDMQCAMHCNAFEFSFK